MLAFEDRQPCPYCGSRDRNIGISLTDAVDIHD